MIWFESGFQYHVSIFNTVDMLILVHAQVDLLAFICASCLSFCMRGVFVVGFSSPSLCPVNVLWLMFQKFCFLPPTSVHATTHTICTFTASVKEDDLQLIINCLGILGIQGRFYLEGRTWKDLLADYFCVYFTFFLIDVGCWELTCFIRETRLTEKSPNQIELF